MSTSSDLLKTFKYPDVWAESYLRNPRNIEKPLELRSYQKEILANSSKEQNMILRWGRRLGKCNWRKGLIINELGELVKVEDLCDKENFGVISCNNKYNFEVNNKTKCVYNGKKPIYELVTKSGRRTKVTDNHPFLTVEGWKPLKDIKCGENIILPSKININSSNEIDDHKVKLIAYLLSDGSTSKYISFGNNIDKIKKEFLECVKLFDCDYTIRKNVNNYVEYYVKGKNYKNYVLNYVISLGLFGKLSYEKSIPNEIMRLSKRQLKIFLSRIFGCNGWCSITKKKKKGRKSKEIQIGYSSSSYELINGISNILMRFGIRHFIYKKSTPKNRINYQIIINTKTDLLNFIKEINIFGKEKKTDSAKRELQHKIYKETYFDSFPKELLKIYNIPTSRKIRYYNRISKSKFLNYAEKHNIESLIDLCKGDIFFDRVESINYLFDDDTYELEVNPSHNYIADNMLMHNSVTLCADTLWWATAYPLIRMIEEKQTNPRKFRVLVFCPYQSQIDELWETYTQLIGDSPLLKEQLIKIRRSDVYSINFKGHGDKEGSTIQGYTIGISSSNQGVSLRGLCLDASTRISMADGTVKLIPDIEIGDKVISYDIVSKSFVNDTVMFKANPKNKELFKVTFSSGRKVISSLEHKFLSDNGYKKLSELNIKDKVIGNNGKYDTIVNIKSVGTRKSYDITTKNQHNFIANGVVTHNSGDMVFIDEMDYIPDEIWQKVIFPITTTHLTVKRRICSTPSGRRSAFYKYCTRANELGWFHRHHASWHPDNDRWLSQDDAIKQGIPIYNSTEYQARESCSSEAFDREYGAEFGDSFGGVYKHHLINNCMQRYGRNIDVRDTDVFDPGFKQKEEHIYIIGVDWNSYVNGGQIVMLEYCTTPTKFTFYNDELKEDVALNFTNKYRLFYRKGVKIKGATQRGTRKEIIRLLKNYKVDYIYVDYGAGDTNIEELTLFGKNNPGFQLDKKLRVVDSGSVVEHWDHVLRKKVKKRNKSLMINFSVITIEEGMIILPKEEDTTTRLVGQMRNYQVKNITSRGEYSYKGEDHILDAFNLALYGFQQNYGSLIKSNIKQSVNHVVTSRTINTPKRTTLESMDTFSTYDMPTSDPEKTRKFQTPKRISVPRIGRRADFTRSIIGR